MTQPYNNVYFLVLLRGVDILFCTWIWRQYDITISSMCGLELRKPDPKRWAVLQDSIRPLRSRHHRRHSPRSRGVNAQGQNTTTGCLSVRIQEPVEFLKGEKK